MNSFSEFEMESMGGVVSFSFSPVENIIAIPEAVNDCISTAITFSGGSAFLSGIALRDSLNLSEKQKIADAGESFSTVISGMIPKLTKEYLYLFNEMKRHRFVVLVTDNNGYLRLCGTKEKGMRFSFDQDSKNSPGQLSGFQFSFTLDGDKPSPFYNATYSTLSLVTPVLIYPQGQQGDSAYQVWIDAGNSGTVQDFILSLKGPAGDDATITEISNVPTAETNTEKILQPNGTGGVQWNSADFSSVGSDLYLFFNY